ncbi:protein sickie-like isoform X2 [Anthonomus grandis grandis]|uniref:protein sickie-like isoform X2 n=1 Tax=Anthonomus grandis grandis TaxID=2921223 RepID=UPI00216695BA|nr:protein sickie-like isoform X2 [Anthonomus grandis grandis]
MFPGCIRAPRSIQGSTDDITKQTKSIVQIYTDWANHYLEKGKSKKRVSSLATDCSDGVLLAEVIESVTSQKIADINRKPKSPSQMLDNINLCLSTLHSQHVQGIEGIAAQELRDGKLKAILALFFALSRHKQATKARQQQDMTPNRSSAIPHKGGTATSAIPLPGSALPARRCPPDKVRPVAGSSRAPSPALSMIPRGPPAAPPQISSPYQTPTAAPKNSTVTQNGSMLDKLKLFKNNEKTSANTNGKRTSSSSGVSSAKSERSDSSASLDANPEHKPAKNISRIKQTSKPTNNTPSIKTQIQKNSPSPAKKVQNGGPKMATEVEKHANKVAQLSAGSKLAEPKVRVSALNKDVKSSGVQSGNGTGIPKPTLAVKGTTKSSSSNIPLHPASKPPTISREPSQHSLSNHKPAVAMVSPMKCEKDTSTTNVTKEQPLSESSASTGPYSNSSDSSSVIYRPSSESSCSENVHNPIPNRQEPLTFLSEPPHIPHPPLEPLKEAPQEAESPIKSKVMTSPTTQPRLTTTIPNHIRQTIKSKVGEGNVLEKDKNIVSMKHIREQSYVAKQQQQQQHHLDDFPDNMASFAMDVKINGAVKEGGGENLSIEPMRPLLRGYCSTLTLPGRQRGGYNRATDGDYCEISLANGYLSESEILRGSNPMDIPDGYLSEGGSVLYSRRLQNIPQNNGSGLTVLTEQSSRRGGTSRDSPPPPPPPAPRGSSKSQRNCGTATSNSTAESSKHSSSSSSSNGHHHWKRYGDSPGVGSPPPPAPGSPTSNRRERRGSPHGKEKGGGGGSKGVRGVPQSFGYVKRNGSGNGGSGAANGAGQGIQNHNGKTASVSAVPRTKVKVSGGTQTCSSDLQQSNKPSPPQFKSYSLTGNTANQLSQSVRERLMMGSQSLPKGGVHQEYGLVMRQMRPKASDGSLSDTQAIENCSPYAPWLRHSNTYSVAPRLSETDSMESLTSLPGHRSSLTHARLLRDSPSRLSRSNSIRSTKSEKLYPSMLHRNTEPETEPYYCLPIGSLSHWSQPTSPAPGNARTFPLSPTHGGTPRHSIPKNDELHGSSISLVSTASSLYSSAEEKQAHEIRKLRRELSEAQEKVHTLTSQLSTNAHVVSAFEQSLTSMTQRLQHLTSTSEKKDSELQELRQAMESLRAQSIQAGIGSGLARQPSSDSVSSLSSACSLDKQEKKKKKGWLRSSFTKAFSRNAKVTKVQSSHSEGENERQHSPPPPAPIDQGQEVVELQKQLREKDMVLTDIRLEALSSAHQLESLKDTVMKMRSEMLSLKQNNERLQRMVSGTGSIPCGELTTEARSNSSLDALSDLIPTDEPTTEVENDGKRVAISVYLGQPQGFDRYYLENYGYDGKGSSQNNSAEIAIAYTNIGASTGWGQLDNSVRRAFKQYVARLDPGGGLGLGSDSIASYKLGEAERKPDTGPPDLLPVGYAVGRVTAVHVVLQPVAALAFEALIPKGVAQRLVSLLSEHRRLVLCGAPGTGKTHLATRLAEFHAQSLGRDPQEAVATFNVDNKSAKELRQYLQHLSEQAASGDNSVLPCVVVLDNLHKAGPLADALGSLPRNLPCLLGTMAQSACSATSLQLQHGFRWVLVAPHMEPARGLLGRVLRRRLAALELEQGPQPELAAILGWLPRVWQHLNAFLETHSSGDVAIGPRLFLSCPLELDAARAWFADVWNYSLAPYLREAAREGLQLYGRRASWNDPAQFILDSYPWPGAPPQGLTTITAKDVGLENNPNAQAESDGDPLLNMLMRLQEAANYSSPHSNDSDCNSLDSNMTHGSSNVGTESVS